jgi:hypothetical protein
VTKVNAAIHYVQSAKQERLAVSAYFASVMKWHSKTYVDVAKNEPSLWFANKMKSIIVFQLRIQMQVNELLTYLCIYLKRVRRSNSEIDIWSIAAGGCSLFYCFGFQLGLSLTFGVNA